MRRVPQPRLRDPAKTPRTTTQSDAHPSSESSRASCTVCAMSTGAPAHSAQRETAPRAPVSLRRVLTLDVFSRAEATVLAGEDHLDQSVRWVHMGEISDIASFLRGGELLLTAGTGIGKTSSEQRRYVRKLARVGASALVLETAGRAFTEVPPAIVETSMRMNLPLVALRREIPFIEVTEQVHALLINQQVEALRRAEAIAHQLTAALGTTERLAAIVRRLAGILDAVVVLEDAAHQIVEYAAPHGDPALLLDSWSRHSRQGHSGDGNAAALSTTDPCCVWASVNLGERPWGRLHVVEQQRPLDEVDRLAVDRGCAAIAMALFAERDSTRIAEHARESVISHLLHRSEDSTATLLDRARHLGVDFGTSRLLAIAARPLATDEVTDDTLRRLLFALRRVLHRNRLIQLSAIDDNQIVALVKVATSLERDELIAEMATELCSVVLCAFGASDAPDPRPAARTLREACRALDYGVSAQSSAVSWFSEMNLHRLLQRLNEEGELAEICRERTRPDPRA